MNIAKKVKSRNNYCLYIVIFIWGKIMIDINNSLGSLGLHNTATHYIRREVSNQNTQAAKYSEDNSQTHRNTYGLAILELMSDQEYQAWLRATAGMTETEKLLAAQKLYPLADIQRLGKKQVDVADNANQKSFVINANKLNGIKMFQASGNFIQRYKNAFDSLEGKINING